MTTTNTTIARLLALVAGSGLVLLSFAVLPAHAQTTTTTTTTTTSYAFTRNLTMGFSGPDVTALQTWLISQGYSIPAGATGYFWTQTRAAVAAYQAAHGIVPPAGFFGPITRAYIASHSTGGSTGGTTGGSGALHGAGRLTNVDEAGDVESSIDEGDTNQRVVGVEADAKDGDVELQRLDVQFDLSGASGSNRLDRYVDTVSVYLDDKKLATMDASDADRNGDVSTLRFSDLNGIIREGDTGHIYVSVNAVDTIDSNDADTDIDAIIPENGLRAVSADGISETYVDNDITNTFTVSEQSTGDLTVSESNDNPDDSVVQVNEDSSTDDVTLLSFNLRAHHQDITVNDLPVDLGVTGTTNVRDVVQSVRLERNGHTLDTATVSGTGANVRLVFNDLNETINADDTQAYDVIADIRHVETTGGGAAFTAGDTLVASTSDNASWDVEDENGDNADVSGTATGGTMSFETTGISVTRTDATATKSVGTTAGSGDSTQYSIMFKVTAGDDDLYIDRSTQNTASPSAAGGGVAWATTTSSNTNVTSTGVANLSAADTNNGDTATSYKVPSGTSRTFTLNVTLTATATGFTGVRLTGINYDTDSNTNDSTLYYTAGLDTFKTQDVSMTTH